MSDTSSIETPATVAVIVLHYNAPDDTDSCLDSLVAALDASMHAVTIYVVDNGSQTAYELPESLQDDTRFKLIRSEANLGFTGGNNLGFVTAVDRQDPDYFLLLNDDATIAPDAIDTLITSARAVDDSCIICPTVYFTPGDEYHADSYAAEERGSVLWYAGGVIDDAHLDAFHRGVDELDRGQHATVRQSDFATGCCLLIPRGVYDVIGGFDDDYFLYLEDVDLSKRAARAGFRIRYESRATAWHDNQGASDGLRGHVTQYYQTRNRLFFFWKYGDIRVKLRVLRVAIEKSINGAPLERQAVIDFFLQRMGKQPVL